MALVAFVSAVKSDEPIFRVIYWVSFLLLVILFFLLIWGLKFARKFQEKLDKGDFEDKEVQKM
ncbi:MULTISPECIES: hypothetical protein [Streptococcus]|uniref:CcmD family protein n=1 Tax=Streptococcus caledonicus TaxID=2614158 RepID=A0ABW0UG97_9STRE|nr:hypothetical protein [Streptococcus sp. S784/96/1]